MLMLYEGREGEAYAVSLYSGSSDSIVYTTRGGSSSIVPSFRRSFSVQSPSPMLCTTYDGHNTLTVPSSSRDDYHRVFI